tara:strand:+ start:408 stop:575 length:168 start_codon:yes stop_codon:yes gene_type:complete
LNLSAQLVSKRKIVRTPNGGIIPKSAIGVGKDTKCIPKRVNRTPTFINDYILDII